jgi:hypothetical protein
MVQRCVSIGVALVAVCLMVVSAEAAAKEKALRGKIVSISASSMVVNVKADKSDKTGSDKTYDVSPNVSITVNGQPGKIDDIKAGDTITYRLDNDGKAVTDINKGKKAKKTT